MRSILRALRALTAALVKDHGMLKVTLHRQHAWLHLPTLRVFPALAGGEQTEEEKAAAAKAAADKAAADAAAAKKAEEDAAAEAEAKRKAEEEEFDKDRAMATIRAQRESEAKAKKERDEALAKLKEREDADLSDAERLKKEAEEGKALAGTGTEKLRKANVLSALADQGLAGAKGRAAARLLDDLEYDAQDEPTNLDAVLAKAKTEFGEEAFTATAPSKPTPPKTDGPAGGGEEPQVELTAEELDAAKQAGMTPERYKAMKGVSNLADFEALQQREREAAAANK